MVKRFRTINYEGDNNWALDSFVTSDGDTVTPVSASMLYLQLYHKWNDQVISKYI